MGDGHDDLAGRLDRIEDLLRRSPSSRIPPGPEVRSARSIVSRIDDVWVAVTEGNERVVATIEQLRPTGDGPHAASTDAEGDAAVHRRLNRVEEALAGIAGQLGAAADGPAGGPQIAAAVERLDDEVRRLGQRVEALARAIEASATRTADGTVTDRIGRLRDQFRR